GGERSHLVAERMPLERGERPRLAQVQQHVTAGTLTPQHMLRIVETGTGKPFGARHAALPEHARVWGRGIDREVIPQRLPEPLQVLDRPAPQCAVVREMPPPLARQPVRERRHVGLSDPLGPRRPQELTWLHELTHYGD